MSNIPPVWWQNSKVSYSYFASGTSSFIDFGLKGNQSQINRNDSHSYVDEGTHSPEHTVKHQNSNYSGGNSHSDFILKSR